MKERTILPPLLQLAGHLRLMLSALVAIHLALTVVLAFIFTTPDPTPTVDGWSLDALPAMLFAIAAFIVLLPLAWAGLALGLVVLDLFGAYWAAYNDYWSQLSPSLTIVAGVLFAAGALLAGTYQIADMAGRLARIRAGRLQDAAPEPQG
jgi:hypothetical protein